MSFPNATAASSRRFSPCAPDCWVPPGAPTSGATAENRSRVDTPVTRTHLAQVTRTPRAQCEMRALALPLLGARPEPLIYVLGSTAHAPQDTLLMATQWKPRAARRPGGRSPLMSPLVTRVSLTLRKPSELGGLQKPPGGCFQHEHDTSGKYSGSERSVNGDTA